MAVDFPASPTDLQAHADRKWYAFLGVWALDEIPEPGPPIAPAVDVEYARVNGVWRKRLETWLPIGLGPTVDADLWESGGLRLTRVTGVMHLGTSGGTSGATEVLVSVDGTNFITGATAYGYLGPYHNSGSSGFTAVGNASAPCLYLTPGADHVGWPQLTNAHLPILKVINAPEWYGSTNSQVYSTGATGLFQHGEWKVRMAVVAGGYTIMQKLRFSWGPSAAPNTGSFITVEHDYV